MPVPYDLDTFICKDSYDIALIAAGCVIHAVDNIGQGISKFAFCPIRPPGHHLGPYGAEMKFPSIDSTGFCILNNVAIGAAYAKYNYK